LPEDIHKLVRRLELVPHPEGGWYRETLRSAYCTTIMYLLPAGQFSEWHRVRDADEVWHHYAGDHLALHTIDEQGRHERIVLGDDVHHAIVPASRWQAAVPIGDDWCLVGCTVAPPFEFARFEIADRATLAAAFPEHERLVARFSRGTPQSG